jgi:glutamate/tyrosine decarboxylase-like PLP-dependent enzyme
MEELRRAVERAPEGFDWDAAQWRVATERMGEVVVAASTDWAARRPSPREPDAAATIFREPLPKIGKPIDELIDRIERDVLPTSAYNGHPRWLAYIMGSPLPVGVLGSLASAALNQNNGLWRVTPSAVAIELQTLRWIGEMLGLPANAEGIFVSGGQMANIVAHSVMRDAKAPWDTRRYGMRGAGGNAPQLRVYASSELHYCQEQAAEFLGMGRETVRRVPVDENYHMSVEALGQMIAEDRRNGDLPIAVAGTAGTVGTGAVDPLPQLLRVARDEDLWFHVDGAYGAFAALAESCPPDLRALAEADSVACDPHKWLYAPIDAAITFVREPGRLERSFAFHASYLETEPTDQEVALLERTPENSRPQRAFKVWLALQALGRDGYAAMIDYNIRLAAYMEALVRGTPALTVAAPRELSIVCWRVEPAGMTGDALDELQTNVINDLERRGIAMISNTTLRDGHTALRACITNFRTRPDDIDAIVRASAEIGAELAR